MAKPAILPRWSTDLSNMTAPSSGQMDTGWTPGQDGVSDYDNYIKYWTYKWLEWLAQAELNDGVADYTLSGAVEDADLSGVADMDNLHTVYITPTADGDSIGGIAAGVDKQELTIINTHATKWFWLASSLWTGSAAANRIIMPKEYTFENVSNIRIYPGGSVKLRYHGASSRWRLIDATGIKYRKRFHIPAAGSEVHSSGSGSTLGTLYRAIGSAAIMFPVQLPAGSLFETWTVYLEKLTNTGTTISTALYYRTLNSASGTVTAESSFDTNADAPGAYPLVGVPVSHPDMNGSELEIKSPNVTSQAYSINIHVYASGVATDKVYGCDVWAYVSP